MASARKGSLPGYSTPLRAPYSRACSHAHDRKEYAMPYNPRRGGHAPGHLRDWLYQYIEGELAEDDPPRLSLERLTGLLWNCTDIMPGDVRGTVSELVSSLGCDDQPIFTVAQACRWLRPNIRGVEAPRVTSHGSGLGLPRRSSPPLSTFAWPRSVPPTGPRGTTVRRRRRRSAWCAAAYEEHLGPPNARCGRSRCPSCA
jgi:hypothetical protein